MSVMNAGIRQAIHSIALLTMLAAGSICSAQTAPVLGTAENFAVLGGSAVTNTGATVVTGDLGIWPNTASSITGFPPGIVTGTIHGGNGVAQQAQADLTVAYNSAAGQACDTNLTGTDLGGLTLNPGVYCFASAAQLTGTLSLDAQGDPDAVFIFQIGTTLTTASNSRVQIINGGSNCNVFWQVGSSATLGTATQFQGNILALTSITAVTGASAAGRMLARNGAVTLDTIAVGGCAEGVCPILELTPTTLPQGTLGIPYSASVTADGGTAPYVYSVSDGALPTGLVINPATGEISGTPLALGNFSFVIRAVDSEGCERTRSYTIIIAAAMCPTINLAPLTLPPATVGQAYSQFIVASGGTPDYLYSVTAGALPPGLKLDTISGELAGMLTTNGNFGFTVTATDSAGCVGSRDYVIIVNPAICPAITLAPLVLPPATVGQAYSQFIVASGGTPDYLYSVTAGALPPGLLLGPNSGELAGMLTNSGNFSFTVTATDSAGCLGAQPYNLLVNAATCPLIAIAPTSLPLMRQGIPYSQTLSGSGGTAPYSFELSGGSLPQGLLLNPLTGVLSGTPTNIAPFNFTITVTDALGCFASAQYIGSVMAAAPPVPVPTLPMPGLLLLAMMIALVGGTALRR